MANGATPVPSPGELLAESAHVAIVRCRSGSVHLQIGPVTLTLPGVMLPLVPALTSIWYTIGAKEAVMLRSAVTELKR